MSERNWTPEELLHHLSCGHSDVSALGAICFVCGEARSRLKALAAVGNPEGLPELLRVLRDPAGEPPIIGRGDGYVEMPLAKYLRIRDAFDALQIDPEKLP